MGELEQDEKKELKKELKREIRRESGDTTEITASMGLFTLEIETEEELVETVEQFERVWTNRISEIKDAESTTKRELEEDQMGLIIG